MQNTIFNVTGLTCGGCVARVKSTLEPFATGVDVTLSPPTATLTNCKADLHTLNKALSAVGQYQLVAQALSAEPQDAVAQNPSALARGWFATYFPLLLIIGFILLVSSLIQFSPIFAGMAFSSMQWMMHFMAGFFLVFAFFKLLDLRGFADSYAMYDVVAMRFKAYAYVYPFLELGLGVVYLLAWQPRLTNSLTLILMVVSSIGVIRAVWKQQKIRCACLGAVFNLPMSTVTIIEDVLMAGMALWMLV